MGAVVSLLGQVALSTALSMLKSLINEQFMKKLAVQALEYVVQKTETLEDDKLLADAKKQWGME